MAAINAAPMPEVAPAITTPAGVDGAVHADVAGSVADKLARDADL